jgi:mRNA-degrading endonuclease RelE of RelBE toxin-antitoxin system
VPNEDEPYEVTLSSAARRALGETLPLSIAEAAWALIIGPVAAERRRAGKPLREPHEGLWSARSGTCRVIYEMDEERRRVFVTRISHRSGACGLKP